MFAKGKARRPALPFAKIEDQTRVSQNPTGSEISALGRCAQCGIPMGNEPIWAVPDNRNPKSCRILRKRGPILDVCKGRAGGGGGGMGRLEMFNFFKQCLKCQSKLSISSIA